MFDFIRNHSRVLFFVMVLLIFPSFVFFGVQGYTKFNDPSSVEVARVDGQKIALAEWDAAHRRQIDQMRRQMPNLDAAFFDSPEVKRESLDAMVRERVLLSAASRAHFSVSDERVQREILSIPQVAALRRPDGSLDVEAYKVLLGAQGLTPEGFEANLRQDLLLRQVLGGVTNSVPPAGAPGRSAVDALLQQREAQVLRFDSKDQTRRHQPERCRPGRVPQGTRSPVPHARAGQHRVRGARPRRAQGRHHACPRKNCASTTPRMRRATRWPRSAAPATC